MNSARSVGVVAGSGILLRALFDRLEWDRPFSDFAGLAGTSVTGHAGRFLSGVVSGIPVIVQVGRLHFYEGFSYAQVTRPVDVMHALGVRAILFTNAAGGLNPDMRPGDLMAVHKVLTWPYHTWAGRPCELTTDFSLPGCSFEGTYVWVPGPNYETRAEVAALRSLGGAAVGMSVAPELHRTHHLGLRAAVISCVTNNCCVAGALSHDDVISSAGLASQSLVRLIRETLPRYFPGR